MKLKTPYADVLLPLSPEEFDALKTSIEAEGVRDPILHTEDGRVLDGHHRLKIDPKAKRHCLQESKDWSDAECMAYVIRCNWQRRNLSPSQKKELRERQMEIARTLRSEGYTQAEAATMLGVSRTTVETWDSDNRDTATNDDHVNTSDISNNGKPPNHQDAKVKLSKEQKAEVVDLVQKGMSRKDVAGKFAISRQQVDNIIKSHERQQAIEQDRANKAAEAAKILDGSEPIRCGDFKEVAKTLADGFSVEALRSSKAWTWKRKGQEQL